jgi:hypothetical protein
VRRATEEVPSSDSDTDSASHGLAARQQSSSVERVTFQRTHLASGGKVAE